SNNTVGGTTAGARNLISGSNLDAVTFHTSGTTGNVIAGNWIGLDVTGTAALPNARYGVRIDSGASGNTIGGTAAGAGNLITRNSGGGVLIDGSAGGTASTLVAGNLIGLAADGTTALGNGTLTYGVLITQSANNT